MRRLVLLAALAAPAWAAQAAGDELRFAVLYTQQNDAVRSVLAGLRTAVGDRARLVEVPVGVVGGVPQGFAGTSVSIALGSDAQAAARTLAPAVPNVACLTLHVANSGVSLEFPFDRQFQTMRRIIPNARNVGVLYSGPAAQKRIEEAAAAARRAGLNLIAREVAQPADLTPVLEHLASQIDVLWGFPDPRVLTPQAGRQVLLLSFRNRVPFVGPSEVWVKAGALYALDWDYQDMGRQCGEVALRVAVAPAQSVVQAPRKSVLVFNSRTAQQMRLEPPSDRSLWDEFHVIE